MEGIGDQPSAPYSSQQNRTKKKSLFSGSCQMYAHREAVNMANYIQNQVIPTKTIGHTPYKLWYQKRPILNYFQESFNILRPYLQ